MGNEGNIGRRRFVDVRIVRSKTGHAILKGGSFYQWILCKNLRQLSKDAVGEINSINYRMKLILEQSAQRMKRSEKLVKTYDLPPLKAKQAGISSGKDKGKTTEQNILKQAESRKTNNHLLSLRQDMRSASPADSRDLRKIFYSPAPCPERDFEDDNNDQIITLEEEQRFPHIKVDKCEEKLPPLSKTRHSQPEYAQKKPERSASSNSLEVPSPMLKRRQDGKCVTILTPNFSHSESSIQEAIQKENEEEDKSLISIMKPLTITCGKTRSTARSQTNALSPRRTVSRSLSPRPRLTNRTLATPTLIIQGSNHPN